MENIIHLATQTGKTLSKKQALLVTAESCTGGGVAYTITEIAGSSEWFDRGFITYSNTSKTELLDIPSTLINQHGAVSGEVATAMAKGALAKSNAHFALSITGIAGPSGAVQGKPVGTIYFSWASHAHTHTECQLFSGNRHNIRQQAIVHALQGLLRFIDTM